VTVVEAAHAKVNLVLRVGPPRADGLHPLCSLFAALELADEVRVTPCAAGGVDEVVCPGVDGENLAARAAAAFRIAAPEAGLPPLRIEIDKRIPVAAGLAGGSADAAAVLRADNELASRPRSRCGPRCSSRSRRCVPPVRSAPRSQARARPSSASSPTVRRPSARPSGSAPTGPPRLSARAPPLSRPRSSRGCCDEDRP
jgi:hypothetical protein